MYNLLSLRTQYISIPYYIDERITVVNKYNNENEFNHFVMYE